MARGLSEFSSLSVQSADDLRRIDTALNRIRLLNRQGARGEGFVRSPEAAIGQHFTAIRRTLLMGNIMCDESDTEKPSPMDATYRRRTVTFRCRHDPWHEFTVEV